MTRNLVLLPAFQAAAFGYAVVPFVWLLVAGRGLGIADYATLQSIYYLTTLVAELPTGILADRAGRRPALLLAGLVQGVGFVAIALAEGFLGFAVGHVGLGIGQALLSGTTSAMLFDSLRAVRQEKDYLRLEASNTLYRLGGSSAAFLIGGFAGDAWGFATTAWLSAAFSAVAAAIAYYLTEPPREADAVGAAAMRARRLLHASLDVFLRDRELRWIALAFALLFVELRIAFHFYTPGLERGGIVKPIAIGAAFAGLNVIAAAAARLTPRMLGNFREARVLLALTAVLASTFALLASGRHAWFVLACFMLQQVPFGIHFPIVNSMVNHRVSSERRATVFSTMSLVGRALFSMVFPLVGLVVTRAGIEVAFATVAVSSLICAALLTRSLRQVRSLSEGDATPAP
jgi:MFS family permease